MTQPEPIQVARINEARQVRALRELAHEAVPVAGGVMTFSPGVPWVNHGAGFGLGESVTDADLDALESYYRERGAPAKIELTIFAPEELLARLGARGFVVEHFETVLARRLEPDEDPFAAMPHGRPAGLVIERTDPGDEERCRLHAIVTARGFMAEPIPEPMIEMSVRALRHSRSAAFMAFIGGEPVAACGMEVFEHERRGACALWGTSVAEPFRRRGVQQALIAHRLAHAIGRGCEMATIESKPGIPTERNAARLGFGLSYVRVCMARLDRAPA